MISILAKYGLITATIFMTAEWLISYQRKDGAYTLNDTATNLSIGVIGNIITVLLWASIAYYCYSMAYAFHYFEISMNNPWAWALCILCADLAWYIEHRINHTCRLFWAVHSIHHSSEKFNFSVAMRLPWLGPIARIPFLLPLCFLGFPPIAVITGFSVVLFYQLWLHTGYISKLPGFEAIFNSPSHHRVHHATNDGYLDKNFGGILILWDRLFGTFSPEVSSPQYGILNPIKSHNPIIVQFRDLLFCLQLLGKRRSIRGWLETAFGNPSEKHQDNHNAGCSAAPTTCKL